MAKHTRYTPFKIKMLDRTDGEEIWETVYVHNASGTVVVDPQGFDSWLDGFEHG